MTKQRVWIDTDPAITSGNGEVDDGYAILQALRSPELNVAGISAVFGNTDIDNTFAMSREILRRSGHTDVPVFKGLGEKGQRKRNSAIDAIVMTINEGPLTLFALGPLTNMAAALTQPDCKLDNVEDLIFVGGRTLDLEFRATPDQETPFRDLNFELDPKAAEDLLSLGIPITLAGWEVSSKMWLTQMDLDHLRDHGDMAAQWLSEQSQGWHDEWVANFKAPGFTPFDTLAIGWPLVPELFGGFKAPARIRYTPERPLFEVDPDIDGPSVTYLRNVDNDAFRTDLMARLLRQM